MWNRPRMLYLKLCFTPQILLLPGGVRNVKTVYRIPGAPTWRRLFVVLVVLVAGSCLLTWFTMDYVITTDRFRPIDLRFVNKTWEQILESSRRITSVSHNITEEDIEIFRVVSRPSCIMCCYRYIALCLNRLNVPSCFLYICPFYRENPPTVTQRYSVKS